MGVFHWAPLAQTGSIQVLRATGDILFCTLMDLSRVDDSALASLGHGIENGVDDLFLVRDRDVGIPANTVRIRAPGSTWGTRISSWWFAGISALVISAGRVSPSSIGRKRCERSGWALNQAASSAFHALSDRKIFFAGTGMPPCLINAPDRVSNSLKCD